MHRWHHTCVATAALLLIGSALPGAAFAGTLGIDASGLDCPDLRGTERLIRSRIGPWTEAEPDVSVILDCRPPAQLVVRLRSGDATTERVLPFSASDCPQLPSTVALLVRSWVNRRWTQPPAKSAPESAEALPEPPSVAPLEPTPPVLALLVGAGLFTQPADGRHAALVAAGVDRRLSRLWGLGVEGRYGAPISQPFGRGTTSTTIWSLATVARLRALSAGESRLDLLAGPGLSLLDEASQNYATDLGSRFFDVGLFAGVRYQQRILPSFWAHAGFELLLRASRERVAVEGLGLAMTLPRARLNATLGVSWEPF